MSPASANLLGQSVHFIQMLHTTSHISQGKAGFQLPPDVSYEKQRLSDSWAYVFRVLGELGRILLQEMDDGRCRTSCEER
jgi:hypothetical protein